MGHRVAHLLGGRMIDWLQPDVQFALVETVVPRTLAGQTLQDAGVRAASGLTVARVKTAGGTYTHATPDTALQRAAVLVVAGPTEAAVPFALLASRPRSPPTRDA